MWKNMLQDHTKWNNLHYPYAPSIFAHNDCANFVSQAMSAGDLPEDQKPSGWYREKESLNYSASWVTVSEFNGHTNDRYKYPFTSASNFTYYVINRS